MQGHLELPRLWEKHTDAVLRDVGLIPTTHMPSLYTSRVNGKQALLKCQVDDFAIAVPDKHTANILLDQIDDFLFIPMKRQGFIRSSQQDDIDGTSRLVLLCPSS